MDGTANASEWSFLATGLLVCVGTICVSYLVLRLWPREHYPRVFATLAGIATVSALYVLNVPGASFGLGALLIMAYFSAHVPEAWEGMFQKPEAGSAAKKGKGSATTESAPPPPVIVRWTFSSLGTLALGVLLGFGVAAGLVAGVMMPPAYWKAWVLHPDAIAERVRRGLNPGEEFVALRSRGREAGEAYHRRDAEARAASQRAADLETALAKAQSELGSFQSGVFKDISLESNKGSRYMAGSVYIGVETAVPTSSFCAVNVSSDKTDKISKNLHIGESLPVQSSKGKFRFVLT